MATVDDVLHQCAAGGRSPVSGGPGDRTDGDRTGAALDRLVRVVPGVEGREHEHGRPPGDGESLSLVAATAMSTAASYWIGLDRQLGARVRTSSVAAWTLSTSALLPEPPVE